MKPTRVLSFYQDSLFVQRGNELVLVNALDGTFQKKWKLPFSHPFQFDRRAVRLLRLGLHALLPLDNGKIILAAKNKIYRFDLADGSVDGLFSDFQGSRPLFLCQTAAGNIYFGDYYHNPDRGPVNIYGSRDQGETYQVVYSFPSGSVRHIHGIFSDPYTDQIWVTTGDLDQESAIWKSGNGLGSLEIVVGGEQRFRAVQLLFSDEYLYYGSDSPLEKNYLYRLNRRTKDVERLIEVQGSVFYGCKVGNSIFFSTVVEPSAVNLDPHVYLWGSTDGKSWKCLEKYRKDILPKKLFQYGQILFPSGENSTGNLWFSPLSVKQDQILQRRAVQGLLSES